MCSQKSIIRSKGIIAFCWKKRTKNRNFWKENLPAQWTLFRLVITHHYDCYTQLACETRVWIFRENVEKWGMNGETICSYRWSSSPFTVLFFIFVYKLANDFFSPQHFWFSWKAKKRKIFYSIFHLLNTLQEWVRWEVGHKRKWVHNK